MDMDSMMEMGEAEGVKSKAEKKAKIKALLSEAMACCDEAGYSIGDIMKDLKIGAEQPDDSDDMEEAGDEYAEDGSELDAPESGESDEGMGAKKALVIAALKKKQGMIS